MSNICSICVSPARNVEGMIRTINLFLVLSMFICNGCATERYMKTLAINTSPRASLTLKLPVLASVYDGRVSGADQNAVDSLQSELTKIYGSSLEWVPYFDPVPVDRVAIRVRIVTLGSSFGSRLVSSSTYATAIQSTQFSVTGPWRQVIGSATGRSSIFANSFSGEGWWNGAAWIDVEVQDNRASPPIRFTIPLAAEHRESNMWGYSSGDRAVRKAWENVSGQLTRTIDEVLRVLRDTGR